MTPTSGLPCSLGLGVVGLDPCQLHSASWLLAPSPLGNRHSSLLPDAQGLLSRAFDRTSGGDSKLKDGRFKLAARKKFFTVR